MTVVRAVGLVAALGPAWNGLFAAGPGVQSRRFWFEATIAAALAGGARPVILAVEDQGRPVAVLPLVANQGSVASLTSPYTTLFQPLGEGDWEAIGFAVGGAMRRWAVVGIEALDAEWAGLEPWLAGLRRAGLVALRYDHFGNWSADVRGLDWAGYLAARPGELREVIRRRGRAIAAMPEVRFEVVDGVAGLGAAMAAYDDVYARSWKVPEPYPRFNEVFLPLAAGAGVLWLAVMWRGDVPIAAQYWTVEHGVATVLKLAHDDAAKALSPGTMLTAHVVRRLLEAGVGRLDFGRGDDGYKQSWCDERRQRMGVLLANPRRPGGLAAIGRHAAGQCLARLKQWG